MDVQRHKLPHDCHIYPLETKQETSIQREQNEMDPNHSEVQARGNWGRKIEFVLSVIGVSVGLGTVWRFPFLVFKNGGGAFLVPFFIMIILIGLPVFFFELAFGQFASKGCTAIWSACPAMKGVGVGMVCVAGFIALYYNLIIAYTLHFFFASMGPLPWVDCNNAWNSEYCITAEQLKNASNDSIGGIRDLLKTPSEEYFYNHVIKMSDGVDNIGGIIWQLGLCIMLCWVVQFVVLSRGVQSMGKVVYVTATFPYIILTIMLIRSATLPGAIKGIEFYVKPDISRLSDPQVWSDSATQIFFILSTCMGGVITMSSYNKFTNNCLRDSIIISVITCATCLYTGFVVFSVLGFMADAKGVEVKDVAEEGPGLVFVVYAEALTQMPLPSLWAILFFLMMLSLGFGSEFAAVETVMSSIMDEFPELLRSTVSRSVLFRAVMTVLMFLLSLPLVTQGGFYIFNLMDHFLSGYTMLMFGIGELIGVMWLYGSERFASDCALMLGKKPNIYYRLTWTFVSPVTLIGLVISKFVAYKTPTLGKYVYPDSAVTLGWLMVVFIVMWIPILAFWSICRNGAFQALKISIQPLPSWGPAMKKDRTGRYAQNERQKFHDNRALNI